jgi:hypothetical protein
MSTIKYRFLSIQIAEHLFLISRAIHAPHIFSRVDSYHYHKPWDFETSLRRTKEGFKALKKSSKSICYEILAVVEIQKIYSKPLRQGSGQSKGEGQDTTKR